MTDGPTSSQGHSATLPRRNLGQSFRTREIFRIQAFFRLLPAHLCQSLGQPCVWQPERISYEFAECLQPVLCGDFDQNSGREPALSTLVHSHLDHLICRGSPEVMASPHRPPIEDYGMPCTESQNALQPFLHYWKKVRKEISSERSLALSSETIHFCRGSTTSQRSKCTCEPEMTIHFQEIPRSPL